MHYFISRKLQICSRLIQKVAGEQKKKLRRDADIPPYRALDLILADEMKALEVQKIACMLSLHDS